MDTTTTAPLGVPVQGRGGGGVQSPGPGTWTLDASHVPRPMCRFNCVVAPPGFADGFADGFARYGSLLEGLDAAVVDAFLYLRMRVVGAPPEASAPPPEEVFRTLLETVPLLRERMATAEAVFAERRWRADLQRWDEAVKPRLVALRRELWAVDLTALDDAALCDHVDRCAIALEEGWRQHHAHNMAALLPVGDLVVHACRWTGLPPSAVLACLAGASRVTRGAPEELADLVEALHRDEEAAALVRDESAEPGRVLEELQGRPGLVGERASAWCDALSVLPVDGEDSVGVPSSLEVPGLVLGRLRAALDDTSGGAGREAAEAARVRVRDAVPPEHRAAFDDLLAEALLLYRLRDERAVYGDRQLGSTARRALLEVGRRLQQRGAVDAPAWAVDLAPDEVRSLLLEGRGPSRDEVAARVRWRETADYRDMPPLFGPPPGEPVPAAWLPPAAARVHEAVGYAMSAVLGDGGSSGSARTLSGLGVSTGVHEGTARVIADPSELSRVQPGDVLVATMTGPAFNLVLPLLGGIVTDRGGLLSHAAIVAREFAVPAVVGCGEATRTLHDGARVRVDGAAGTVTLL